MKKSITTKKGDKGRTRLYSGKEVSKNSPQLNALGDMDELVSVLGIARNQSEKDDVKDAVFRIQKSLFVVAAELAATKEKAGILEKRVDQKMLDDIEEKRQKLEEKVELLDDFVIPGKNLSSAYLDFSRTIARKCERNVAGLFDEEKIDNEIILIWLNRLSDYLFLLARYEEN